MQKVTIKEYAIKHKLSIFNVMKMIKTGKLKTETKEVKGKEITYIFLDEKIEKEVKEGIVNVEKKVELRLQTEMNLLRDEVKLLRAEVAQLKKRIS